MKPRQRCCALIVVFALASTLSAQDYRFEALDEGPPADGLSSAVAELLSKQGIRVVRGEGRGVCDIWLCKEIPVQADFEPTPEVSYPFASGQLIGAVRYPRRGRDFRDQRINRGVYTLRYAHQPVDGAHVGTSLTRDFLLLVNAEQDQQTANLDFDSLAANSAEAAGTSHPCLLSLQRTAVEGDRKQVRHDERHDWWIVPLESQSPGEKKVLLDLVVVGMGEE